MRGEKKGGTERNEKKKKRKKKRPRLSHLDPLDPDDIHVPLVVLPPPPSRRPLVPPALPHREPLGRERQALALREHQTRERGRQLRAQRDAPAALVLEVVKLARDLLSRLPREERLGLEHGRLEALEAVRARDGGEVFKEPVAGAEVGRREVPGAPGGGGVDHLLGGGAAFLRRGTRSCSLAMLLLLLLVCA